MRTELRFLAIFTFKFSSITEKFGDCVLIFVAQ